MRLVPEIQSLTEAPGKVGLEGRDRLGADSLEVAGARCELSDVGRVAAMRHDQRPVHQGAGQVRVPPGGALFPEPSDEGPGALELAPGRQHSPRIPGTAV